MSPPPNITHARIFFAHKDGRIFLPTHWITKPLRSDNAWFPISVVPFFEAPEFSMMFRAFFHDRLPVMETEKWDTGRDMMNFLYKVVGVRSHKALVNNAASFVSGIDGKGSISCYVATPGPGSQWGDSKETRVGAETDSSEVIAMNVLELLRDFYRSLETPTKE